MIECIIRGMKHQLNVDGKCILCDKQFCSCNNNHGLAKYYVRSHNDTNRDIICDNEIKGYLKRGWTIIKRLRQK